ncbi:hypothetical protein K491DRAFT_718782 [Lophiostoma macrostomum CBS 122681]|uniref:Uncharacterized protein n=1 Tax=Lophiostoma macrostomum CBS 122681 TaxID=1314788 RepID=A0A6A6T288_9PLEO|nr:hypothetical protein K491DRAFT_718782 [Lophiostoma macrostomum CBS 122681]
MSHFILRRAAVKVTNRPRLNCTHSFRPYYQPTAGLKLRHAYSSGSPSNSNPGVPANHFIKTGEKEPDPAKIDLRSDEYSQSGGDDVVAEQAIASFERSSDTSPQLAKTSAGKGNVVNPLEISPATPELSRSFEETIVMKNVEREPNAAMSGQGITKKSLKVEKKGIVLDKLGAATLGSP